MTTSEKLRGEVAALEAQAAELEKQAATADVAELPTIGGTLAAIGAKLKSVRGNLADALSLEAQRERERRARAEAQARQELLDRAGALEAQWLAWLADFDAADKAVAGLWDKYRNIMELWPEVVSQASAAGLYGEVAGKQVGNLTGAAGESHAGIGRIVWRRG